MSSLQEDRPWDPSAETARWHELAEKAGPSYERLKQSFLQSGRKCLEDQLSHLCLAEFDALAHFDLPKCLSSRAAFIAELKRLVAEPTTPSLPVFSEHGYREGQKLWLEWLIEFYEKDS